MSALSAGTGVTVLSLIADPLCVRVLRAHGDGPLRLSDLDAGIGDSTLARLRSRVAKLRGIGALARQVRSVMPYTVENELTDFGNGMLAASEVVEAWLARAPQGAIPLGSKPAKSAIRALVNGWESTILRALAVRPHSLTELSAAIPDMSYPSIERRLSAMRAAGQVEIATESGGPGPYAVTAWTREAVGPLVAARRCECLNPTATAERLGRVDIEADFLLAVPLALLGNGRSGSCLLAFSADGEPTPGSPRGMDGIQIEIENGRARPSASRREPKPRTWACGTVDAWVEAIASGQAAGLRTEGEDPALAGAIISALRTALPLPRTRRSP